MLRSKFFKFSCLSTFNRHFSKVLSVTSVPTCKSNLLPPRKEFLLQCTTRRWFADVKCHLPLVMDPVGKVAIITGGETGIGLAAAKDLLTNGLQAVVLAGVCDGETVVKDITKEFGEGKACFMHMDVNDPRDFEELFYRVDLVYGGVDILFNNAGILQDHVWEYEVDTNLKAVLKGTLLGFDYMGKEGRGKRRGQGLIINHADVAALDASPFTPAYVATKAGVLYSSLSFGNEYHYGMTGVRVVCLLSGPTETSMLLDVAEKQYNPAWGRALHAKLVENPHQSAEVVGKAVTHIVKHAQPGSLWTVERGTLYLTKLPDWRKHNTMVTQL